MRHYFIKTIVLLLAVHYSALCCNTKDFLLIGDPSDVPIKASHVQGIPKSSSILASVDGHYLTVVFTENLGEVRIVVSEAGGGTFDIIEMYTPNGYSANILDTGSYVVTFYLTNGDEYYGEFDVTD